MMRAPVAARAAPSLEQINAEVFTLTYGSIVRQLISDFEDLEEVNKQLEQMGYNIGIRLVDEFLAKAKITKCSNFRESLEAVAKHALPMFLNVSAQLANLSSDGTECSLIMTDNPLADFVELPDEYRELEYCNLLCGVVRGALDMVSFVVDCRWVQDMLKGAECYEMRIRLKEHRVERYPLQDDD